MTQFMGMPVIDVEVTVTDVIRRLQRPPRPIGTRPQDQQRTRRVSRGAIRDDLAALRLSPPEALAVLRLPRGPSSSVAYPSLVTAPSSSLHQQHTTEVTSMFPSAEFGIETARPRPTLLARFSAALALTASLAMPFSALAQGKPETTKAKLGYIALTDFAPLAIAKEKGMFAKHGMPDVEVLKQASWGATRDNLELGSEKGGIDGAHILTPMPYAMTLGLNTKGNKPIPMYILARLNYNNQAISVAEKYKASGLKLDASVIKPMAEKAKAKGAPLTFAMTFPTGTHNYWIRYWLAAGGIDPDLDVNTIVIPPPQMVANMRVGTMDAFCVGEPWNQQLINQKIGYSALQTQEIWKDHPEKALGMRKEWCDKNPIATKALLKAVMEAQMWCDKDENKVELSKILAAKNWINCQVSDLEPRLKGETDYGDGRPKKKGELMKFWRDNASFPYKSHDIWFLAETRRWGFLPKGIDYNKVVGEVNRADLWRECAKELGVPEAQIPATDSRGKETFFDGVVFDPENPEAYLASLKIKNIDGAKKKK
jgi:nitrate/nitrite transport system substrate-binding protein